MEGFSDGGSTPPASTIERKSEPCFVWGTIFVQTKKTLLAVNGRECPLFVHFGVRLSIEKVRFFNGVNPLRR